MEPGPHLASLEENEGEDAENGEKTKKHRLSTGKVFPATGDTVRSTLLVRHRVPGHKGHPTVVPSSWNKSRVTPGYFLRSLILLSVRCLALPTHLPTLAWKEHAFREELPGAPDAAAAAVAAAAAAAAAGAIHNDAGR